MVEQYTYDAFISYRHLPLDAAVAERLQTLLERYRPPRGVCGSDRARVRTIFRDKTELPTSTDLSAALQQALLSSRFLIVVLSEQTQDSKWCMEEIRLFKEAHGGKVDHILPVLVSGDPETAIPQLLRWNGELEVEPLCCDIRADRKKGVLKKLKTEFLRLAAPMLDCSFDTLYQRHKRRSRQKAGLAVGISAAVLALLLTVGLRGYQSYTQYRQNLKATYLQQGASHAAKKPQEALMYYAAALDIDPTSQAAQTGALLLLQEHTWLNSIGSVPTEQLQPLYKSEFGTHIAMSTDGSCHTYWQDKAITFYWPDTGKAVTAPLPEDVNPACTTDSVIGPKPYAMAMDTGRVVIAIGGYLWLYDLQSDDTLSPVGRFDLAGILPEGTELDVYNEGWANASGNLLALGNGAHAAIFNVTNQEDPCLNALHTAYGYGLNEVIFRADSSGYALVYGNDSNIATYNPGGYVQVCDSLGKVIFTTPEDPAMAPEGAAFHKDGTHLLVWGSSQLQIWDLEQNICTATLTLDKITAARWLEDGTVAVSNGSDTDTVYAPTAFLPTATAPEIPEAVEDPDTTTKEFPLANGYILTHNYSRIWLLDAQGNQLEEIIELPINRVCANPEENTVWFWYDNTDTLLRIRVNDQGATQAEILDAQGQSIVDVCAVSGGAVAFTGSDSMLYYIGEDTAPRHTMFFGTSAVVKGAAAAHGLLAVHLNATEFYSSDSTNFQSLHSLELWDLDTGLCLARPVVDSTYRITDLALTEDGWLVYQLRDKTHAQPVATAEPDAQTIAFLAAVSCYGLSGEDTAVVRQPQFQADTLGSWAQTLTAKQGYSKSATAEEPLTLAQTHIANMNAVLQKEGSDAWIAAFNALWEDLEPGAMTLTDTLQLFSAYLNTSNSLRCYDQQLPAFQYVTQEMLAYGPPSYTNTLLFTLATSPFMQQTTNYDAIMVDYWLQLADLIEVYNDPANEDYEQQFMTAYDNRIFAGLLQGEGVSAYYTALDEDYWDIMFDLLEAYNMDTLLWLVYGDAEIAAYGFEVFIDRIQETYSYDAETCAEEIRETTILILYDLNLFAKRGIITEADFSTFLDTISVTAGVKLSQLSLANHEAGMRLGDVVIAVDGIHVANVFHLHALQQAKPDAAFTVLRNGQTFTTEIQKNWRISASNWAG